MHDSLSSVQLNKTCEKTLQLLQQISLFLLAYFTEMVFVGPDEVLVSFGLLSEELSTMEE